MVSRKFLVAMLLAVLVIEIIKSSPVSTDRKGEFVAGDPLTEKEFNTAHSSISGKGESLVPNMDFGKLNKHATNLVGGDMVVTKGKSVGATVTKWPNAQIPYVISAGFTTEQRQIIAFAMKAFHDTTCIRFVPRKSEADYIMIAKTGTGCNSPLGKAGGKQVLSLDDGCLNNNYPGVPMHEMMHAAGFVHEHQRPDQTKYINVLYDNIKPDWRQWFKPLPANEVNTLGLPYDTKSVMHYVSFASSAIDDKKPIILAKDGSYTGNDKQLTSLDIQKLNKFYNCYSG